MKDSLMMEKNAISYANNNLYKLLNKLGKLRNSFDETPLLSLLKHPSDKVRYLAVKNLAKVSKISFILKKIFLFSIIIFSTIFSNSTSKPIRNIPHYKHAKINSPSMLIEQTLNNNPDVIELEKEMEILKLSSKTAKAFPNPEVELEGVFASEVETGEFSLLQPIDIGGKRKKRATVILANAAQSKIQLMAKKENLVIETMADLHRLRQIGVEIELIKESASSFMGIKTRYKKLPKLNPEQTVSLSIIEMILSKLSLYETRTLGEQKQIISDLKNRIGCALDCEDIVISKISPAPISNWPKLKVSKDAPLKGSQFMEIKKSIDLAKTQFELTKAETWPDLLIGPKVEYDSENVGVGFSLSLSLPIFNLNKGEKKAKRLKLQVEKDMENVKKTKLIRKRLTLVEKYQQLVSKITQINVSKIEDNHKKLHGFLKQGILPFALIVEAHDEYLSFYQEKHEVELEAITSYWSVLAIDGRIFEEIKK